MKEETHPETIRKENLHTPMIIAGVMTLALLIMGWFMFLTTGMIFEGNPNFNHYNNLYDKRIILSLLGLGTLICAWLIPLKFQRKFSWGVIFLAVILLVAAKWTPLGYEIRGAARWLKFGDIFVQPLEFVKIFLIMWLAHILGSNFPLKTAKRWVYLVVLIFVGFLAGMVLMQPDLSGAAILFAIAFTMIVMSGVPWKIGALMIAVSGLGFTLAMFIMPDKLQRFLTPFMSLKELGDDGYQVMMSIYAITNGGWTGRLSNGSLAMYSLPDHQTDFIFAVICEQWGALGGLAVIIAFTILVLSALYITIRQKDIYRILLGSGISALLCYQSAIHILVNTKAFPITGQPLPFISDGGSCYLMSMIAIGLLMNLAKSVNDEPDYSFINRSVKPIKATELQISKKPKRPDFKRKYRTLDETQLNRSYSYERRIHGDNLKTRHRIT